MMCTIEGNFSYSFNIHNLGTRKSYFYVYDEIIARKDADKVVSMLDNYCMSALSPDVKHLVVFCDPCASLGV